MTPADKKALVADYKRASTIAGVFAVVCTATGQVWVGTSRHIDTQKNGIWFSLKMGRSPFRSLQAVWDEYAPEDFRFEQLDRLPEDTSAMARDVELKTRAHLWRQRLQAASL